MASEASFSAMMSKLRAGDEDAASQVFQRYVKRLIALASRQFDAGVRSKEDPEDVVNSVLKSFFVRDDRKPYELANWEGLWALLATITVRKCIARRQFWKAACRDVNREVKPASDAPTDWIEAIDREPTAEEATVLKEEIRRLVDRFLPSHRPIAELHLQNYPTAEIAEKCGCSARTARRVGERIHTYLHEFEAEGRED